MMLPDYFIRLVEEEDAEFILGLRTNATLNRYLNSTAPSIDDQKKWIKAYKSREAKGEEFYYIVMENGYKRGVYRIYNINRVSFTVGSWLFEGCSNLQLPILTDLLMGDIGFYNLKKKVLLFDVRKENRKVLQYHALKLPLHYNDDEHNSYFLLTEIQWETAKNNILAFFGVDIKTFEAFKANYSFSNS